MQRKPKLNGMRNDYPNLALFHIDISLAIKQIGDYDINVISGLLKLYFRGLPEPLISTPIFIELMSATCKFFSLMKYF